jgi:hypothetical protein
MYLEKDIEIQNLLTSLLNYDVARIIVDKKIYLEKLFTCDGCGKKGIEGKKYKICKCTYGCDYCGNCYVNLQYCNDCNYLRDYRSPPSP